MPQKIDAPGSLRRSATLVLNVRDEAHRGRVIRWHSSRGRRAKVPALGRDASRPRACRTFARWMAGFNPPGVFFSSVSRLRLGKDPPRGEKSFAHQRGAHVAGEVQSTSVSSSSVQPWRSAMGR